MSLIPTALYIHWPFCKSKCPYCDFNSHVREKVEQDQWRRALVRELETVAAELGPGRELTSIFFGGGTPSLMPPETVAALVETAHKLWPHPDDLEITLEANPTSSEAAKFQLFRQAGVNRVSIGVQSLNERDLKFLGRQHSSQEAIQVIEMARIIFPRYSFDLIYARPDQTIDEWRQELGRAIDLADSHLSLYQLTIEPQTAFYTSFNRGDFKLPDEDTSAQLLELTYETLAEAGIPPYEVSNFARPGHESRHNLVYWRYHDFIGIGPGAHGRLTLPSGPVATRRMRAPETWLASVEAQGHGEEPRETLTPRQQFDEALLMGLRLWEGVSVPHLRALDPCSTALLLESKKLGILVREGLISQAPECLTVTMAGRLKLNSVISYLSAI